MANWKTLVIISGLTLTTLIGCSPEQTTEANDGSSWEKDGQAVTLADKLKTDDSLETVTDPSIEEAYLSLVTQHPIADLVLEALEEQGCDIDNQSALVLNGSGADGEYTVVDIAGGCNAVAIAQFAAVVSNGLTADVVEVSARIIEGNNELWSVVHDLSQELDTPEEEEIIEEDTTTPAISGQFATLLADEGVVFASNQVIGDGSGFKVDIVAHKHGNGLDLKGGRQGTNYLPIKDFGAATFQSIADVPCDTPDPGAKNNYKGSLAAGQAFTVNGNISGGLYRVRIIEATPIYVTVEYAACN